MWLIALELHELGPVVRLSLEQFEVAQSLELSVGLVWCRQCSSLIMRLAAKNAGAFVLTIWMIRHTVLCTSGQLQDGFVVTVVMTDYCLWRADQRARSRRLELRAAGIDLGIALDRPVTLSSICAATSK